MNNVYPPWWDATITIYNRYEDPQTHIVVWYRSVVTGAFWKYTGDKTVINKVVLETNNTICRIRKDDRFLPKYRWVSLPNDQMQNYFTLSQNDILVYGEVDDTIDEYTSGKRSTDLEKKYKYLQGCIRIDKDAINVGAGRCSEHYYVKGT